MLHPLTHMVHHDQEAVERAVVLTVTDSLVPALLDLITKNADEALQVFGNGHSPFARDVVKEMMITELTSLFALTEAWTDECIRPHQLTRDYARAWLTSPAMVNDKS